MALLVAGCSEEGARHEQKMIVEKHAPAAAQIVIDDLERHRKGLKQAAARLAPGFVKVRGEQRERELRWALERIHEPPKGIQTLMVSPMSFMAAVDQDGVVIARDAQPDHMKGMDLAKNFEAVARALEGRSDWQVGEFESLEEGGESSVTILMAAPARHEGEVVGAVVLGIPLWRMAQRITRQLQLNNASEEGIILWAYIYRGDRLFHHGTPPDLDTVVPGPEARERGLRESPGGFTGEVAQFGRWYGYGVRPLRMLGDETGIIIFRSDPQ